MALFTVLFTDGQRASLPALKENWRLSGRALVLGMPLTMGGIALLAHFLTGLDWPSALLLGAILSPTDPVFASALVGRPDVPLRLRRLLNFESGVNDGVALTFVVIFLSAALHKDTHPLDIAGELVLGVAIGFVIAAVAALAWRTRLLTAEARLQPLGGLAVALTVYASCHVTHANPYLAAFVAGSTFATMDQESACRFQPFGDLLAESTKFGALLVFGALITPARLMHLDWRGWLLVIVTIAVVRPVSLLLSLIRTELPGRQRLTAAWFGPKGFASVVYGLLALQSGVASNELLFDLVTATIALSIVLHSSTDVPVAKMLHVEPPHTLPAGREEDTPQRPVDASASRSG